MHRTGETMRSEAVINLQHAPPTPILDHEITDRRAWRRDDLRPQDWTVPLDADAQAELHELVAAFRRDPLPLLLRTPDGFALPACRRLMVRVQGLLRDDIGLCVVDALPLDELETDDAIAVYWVLGQLLAPTVAQKWDGTMIYDVRDTGRPRTYGVRGSWTNTELTFHTDNAFAVAPPDYVSLLCLHPAREGGVSRFCSLYTVHNELLRRHPRLLRRLYEPVLYDRQAEHAPDAPRVARVAPLAWDGRRLWARLSTNLARQGYELAGEAMDAETADAFAALGEVMADESLWVEFTIRRGEMQYLNNWECAHYRSEFVDDPDPVRRRHMVRLWYREHGRRSYDG